MKYSYIAILFALVAILSLFSVNAQDALLFSIAITLEVSWAEDFSIVPLYEEAAKGVCTDFIPRIYTGHETDKLGKQVLLYGLYKQAVDTCDWEQFKDNFNTLSSTNSISSIKYDYSETTLPSQCLKADDGIYWNCLTEYPECPLCRIGAICHNNDDCATGYCESIDENEAKRCAPDTNSSYHIITSNIIISTLLSCLITFIVVCI